MVPCFRIWGHFPWFRRSAIPAFRVAPQPLLAVFYKTVKWLDKKIDIYWIQKPLLSLNTEKDEV